MGKKTGNCFIGKLNYNYINNHINFLGSVFFLIKNIALKQQVLAWIK